MAYPLINPSHQFFDTSGSPLVGGTLEFRDPTTNNYINSYPTADDADAQTNANANPLTLDSRGGFTGLYLEDGVSYKIILKDSAGATVDTQDDVLCPLPFSYAVTAAETSAGVTPVNLSYPPGNVLRYGANTTPGTTDMITPVGDAIAAMAVAKGTVVVPEGIFYLSAQVDKTVSNVRIVGPGHLLCATAGLKLVGDDNYVEGLTVYTSTKSVAGTPSYTVAGIYLNGDDSQVTRCEVYNIHGPGILLSGRHCSVTDCNTHDNEMGILLAAECRNCLVDGNHIIDNGIDTSSGFDGILSLRNAEGITITNNRILGSGEHGVYAQGQRIIVDSNVVEGSGADGVKFGSYDDGLYTYGGETLNKWVDGTGYGCSDCIVSNNYIGDSAGGDGIYVQPSMRQMVIEGNTLVNNDIRTVYFNYTGGSIRLEDILDIQVLNNSVKGTTVDTGNPSEILIAAHSGVRICGNNVEGDIQTSAPNAATTPRLSQVLLNGEISYNETDSKIQTSRCNRMKVIGNIMPTASINDSTTNCYFLENTILDQASTMVPTRFLDFSRNDVTCLTSLKLMEGAEAMETCCDNRFIGDAWNTDSAWINMTTASDVATPVGVRFNGNYISTALSKRPLKLSGSYGTVANNTIVNDGTNDYVMDIEGSFLTITGNSCKEGSIHLRNSSSIVMGNMSDVTEAAGKVNKIGLNSETVTTTIVAITDNSGGTGTDTLIAQEAGYVQATVRDNFATLSDKIEELRVRMRTHGLLEP